MNKYPFPLGRFEKQLDHSTHYPARFGATFFITICCEARVANQLCREDIARVLFETGRCYHDTQKWYLKILLLMPDHLHMLVGIPGNADLSNLPSRLQTRHCDDRKDPLAAKFFRSSITAR